MKSLFKFLNIISKLLITIYAIIATNAYANNYYGSFGINNTMLTNKTYDYNEDYYPYKFSTNAISFRAEVGKQVNEKFDLGFEVMTTNNFDHKYTGPIDTIYDSIPGIDFTAISQEPTIYTEQKIKSTTVLVQGKYKYKPYFFSSDANIYGRTGIGLALNKSSNYLRNIMESLEIMYPGDTKINLGVSIGGGFEKKLGKAKISIGYDCYSVGSFKTKEQAFIKDFSRDTTLVEVAKFGDIVGKQLRPINTLLHSINISIGFDF